MLQSLVTLMMTVWVFINGPVSGIIVLIFVGNAAGLSAWSENPPQALYPLQTQKTWGNFAPTCDGWQVTSDAFRLCWSPALSASPFGSFSNPFHLVYGLISREGWGYGFLSWEFFGITMGKV